MPGSVFFAMPSRVSGKIQLQMIANRSIRYCGLLNELYLYTNKQEIHHLHS